MLMGDEAKQHTEDKCGTDKSSGWKAKRKMTFQMARTIRHLYSRIAADCSRK